VCVRERERKRERERVRWQKGVLCITNVYTFVCVCVYF